MSIHVDSKINSENCKPGGATRGHLTSFHRRFTLKLDQTHRGELIARIDSERRITALAPFSAISTARFLALIASLALILGPKSISAQDNTGNVWRLEGSADLSWQSFEVFHGNPLAVEQATSPIILGGRDGFFHGEISASPRIGFSKEGRFWLTLWERVHCKVISHVEPIGPFKVMEWSLDGVKDVINYPGQKISEIRVIFDTGVLTFNSATRNEARVPQNATAFSRIEVDFDWQSNHHTLIFSSPYSPDGWLRWLTSLPLNLLEKFPILWIPVAWFALWLVKLALGFLTASSVPNRVKSSQNKGVSEEIDTNQETTKEEDEDEQKAEKRSVYQTRKNRQGVILALCNDSESWSPRPTARAVADIENGRYEYWAQHKHAQSPSKIIVVEREGRKHLRTSPDGDPNNNLDHLPDCRD